MSRWFIGHARGGSQTSSWLMAFALGVSNLNYRVAIDDSATQNY